MDVRTAIFWNHIFGSTVWALLMMAGLGAIVVGIILRKHKKVRNALLISGFLSVVLFVLSCVGSIFTYVQISRYRPEHEYETAKPIDSKILDHVYLGYPDEEVAAGREADGHQTCGSSWRCECQQRVAQCVS